jgi:hypothetical protein
VNVVDPRGMSIRDWVDSTLDLLSSFVPIMKIEKDEQWREWGNFVRLTLKRRGILVPDPSQFPEFEDWAFRFNQVIALI